jgi:hypothetical protein
MKKRVLLLTIALLASIPSSAELRRVELKVFGMD